MQQRGNRWIVLFIMLFDTRNPEKQSGQVAWSIVTDLLFHGARGQSRRGTGEVSSSLPNDFRAFQG
jgi:hypothetical protein